MKTTVWPAAGFGVVVLITIAVNGPVFTVIVELAVTVPEVAVMVAVPGGFEMADAAVTRPPVLTVATAEADVLQVAVPVRLLVLPSSKVPVAVSCWVCPWMSDTEVGATVSEVSVGFTKKPRHPVARANIKRVANAAKSRSFRIEPGIIEPGILERVPADAPCLESSASGVREL